MKLSSKVSGSYSYIDPSIARDKLKFGQYINSLIDETLSNNDLTTINTQLNGIEDSFNHKTDEEFISVIKYLRSKVDEYCMNESSMLLQNLLFVTRTILKAYKDHAYDGKTEVYNSDIVNLFKEIYRLLSTRISNSEEHIHDMYCDAYIRYIGNIVSTMKHKISNDAPYPHRVVTPVDISTDLQTVRSIVTESIDGGSVIKSIANYSDTRYFPQLTHLEFSPDSYIEGIYHEMDDDYVINRISKLPDFLKSIIHKDNCYDAFIHICEYLYDKFTNNATALDILGESIKECIKILENTSVSDYAQKESFDRMLDYCNLLSNSINEDNSILDRKPVIDRCPLIEMGFGYIYDILPSDETKITEDNINAIGKAMVEAAEEYEVLDVLTEAFGRKKSNSEIRKQIKTDAKNDLYRQKFYDEYADERRASDDKYSDKRRKKNDDYDFKRREEQDEYERKKEEKERKRNRTKTAWSKWKTMELTTPAVYSATRALKKLLAATAVGGVAYAAGFNPVFLPIVYLIGKYMRDKSNPEAVKMKIMSEIKQNLTVIDAKIDQAERQNDMKQKYELLRMKDKLESQFKQMGYGSTSGIGGKV